MKQNSAENLSAKDMQNESILGGQSKNVCFTKMCINFENGSSRRHQIWGVGTPPGGRQNEKLPGNERIRMRQN